MSDNVEDYFEVWKSCREDVIKLLRDLGDEIQKHENNSRIAILTGSSASVAGTIVTIGSLVSAFFTAGVALPITLIVGSVTAFSGGMTACGTEGVNYYLRKKKVKLIDDALMQDEKNTEKLNDAIQQIKTGKLPAKLLKKVLYAGRLACTAGGGIYSTVKGSLQLADTSMIKGAEGKFFTFSTIKQVAHGAGIFTCGLSLTFDIYTIVKTSVAVHKGKLLPVVEDIRKIANALEQEKLLKEPILRQILNALNAK